ncbi:MAG: hypothetical protein JNK87_35450, partial [Bryobacterales bacterium]|nr:hypothetical protein [Bryobacterales bacterium]
MKQFNGSKARFDVGRESYALYKEDPKSTDVIADPYVRRPGSFNRAAPQHIRNFLECVRSRQQPNAPVEAGQATNVILCLAMDSLRQGKRMDFKPRA